VQRRSITVMGERLLTKRLRTTPEYERGGPSSSGIKKRRQNLAEALVDIFIFIFTTTLPFSKLNPRHRAVPWRMEGSENR